MIEPKTTEINGQPVREQTLDEFLSVLDRNHCAVLQLGELRQTLADQTQALKAVEEQKLDLIRQIDDLVEKNKAALAENGEIVAENRKLKMSQKNAAARAKAKAAQNPTPVLRPEGDAGDSL